MMAQPFLQKFGSDNFKGEIYCLRGIGLPSTGFQIESRIFYLEVP
jgi:hypothetical protein